MNVSSERTIVSEVIQRARHLVLSNVGVTFPPDTAEGESDDMCDWASSNFTEEDALTFLSGKLVIDDDHLLELACRVGVRKLFTSEGWLDHVINHILEHSSDCLLLWDHIKDCSKEK